MRARKAVIGVSIGIGVVIAGSLAGCGSSAKRTSSPAQTMCLPGPTISSAETDAQHAPEPVRPHAVVERPSIG